MKKERNSSFELLRILCMLLIVLHHMAVYTNFHTLNTIDKTSLEVLSLGGKIGVEAFVLIGSYFLIGRNFKMIRPLSIVVNTIFYFYAILLVSILLGIPVLNYVAKASLILPFPKEYWFVVYYVLLLISAPILNIVIDNLSKRQYELMLLCMFVIWCLCPTFIAEDLGYSEYILFISLYFVAGYIKIYPNKLLDNKKLISRLTLLSIILTILSVIMLNVLGLKINAAATHSTYFLGANKLLTVTNSIGLFCVFRNLQIKSNKTINSIAASSFGIYLIHENPVMRKVIWNYVSSLKINVPIFIYGLIAALVVYIVCLFIDQIKKIIFDRFLDKIALKVSNMISNKVQKFLKN
ncbi:acyltransferase [Enterococcus casseliflavus]|uniref:acyltransferase n=1 Tax=Enterococcus casseliflavus TaxID=37734 RepID=UPI003D09A5CD